MLRIGIIKGFISIQIVVMHNYVEIVHHVHHIQIEWNKLMLKLFIIFVENLLHSHYFENI